MMKIHTVNVFCLALMVGGTACLPLLPPEDQSTINTEGNGKNPDDKDSTDNTDPDATDGATVVSVTMVPNTVSLQTGGTQFLSLRANQKDGNYSTVSGTATWTTSQSTIATVQDGNVTAVALGSATIQGCHSNFCASCTVTVTAPSATVTSIVIAGAGGILSYGNGQQLSVTITYSDDSTSDDPSNVFWTAINNVVGVASAGLVTGARAGSSVVTASAQGMTSNSITYAVKPDALLVSCTLAVINSGGGGTSCTVHGIDGGGASIESFTSGRAFLTVSPSNAATISGLNVTAGNYDGVANVTATYSGSDVLEMATGSTSIEVVTIGSVSISPSAADLVSGTDRTLTATLSRQSGGEIPSGFANNITWTTSNGDVFTTSASVGTSTVVTAGMVGQAEVTAALGAVQSIDYVFRSVPASVAISSSATTVEEGSTLAFTYSAMKSGGAVQAAVDGSAIVAWSAIPEAIATISTAGLLTAHSVGSVVVSATVNGVSSGGTSVSVTVGASPNPSIDGTLLFLQGDTIAYGTVSGGTPTLGTVSTLDQVIMGGAQGDYTGPRFVYGASSIISPRLVVIGRAFSGAQTLYVRGNGGSLAALATLDVVTSPRGPGTPGSATAFGLVPPRHNTIVYSTTGNSPDVDVRLMDVATQNFCDLMFRDVERVAPLPTSEFAMIWNDNIYRVSPAMQVVGEGGICDTTFDSVTTSGGYSGALLFGYNNGIDSDWVAALSPDGNGSTWTLDLFSLFDGTQVSKTVAFSGAELSGTFVTSTASGFLDGWVVVEAFTSYSSASLYAFEPTAATVVLHDLGHSGAAVIDTGRNSF